MRLRPVLAAVMCLGAVPALAQDATCTPVTDDDVNASVDRAYDALYDDDVEGFQAEVSVVRAVTHCLDGPVPAQAWSRLLYGMALVRYADGRPWQPLVDAALRADADLPRRFGPPDVKTYTPAPPSSTVGVPAGRWYVDGVEVSGAVDMTGPHIVQRQVDGVWRSAWLDDATAFPADWAQPLVGPPGATAPTPSEPRDTAVVESPTTPSKPVNTRGGSRDAVVRTPTSSATRAAAALRVHAGTGASMFVGQAVEASHGSEPGLKVVVPVELGLHADIGAGWLRLVGSFSPMVNGQWVYEGAEGSVSTRFGGGLDLAGGGSIGVGHVGLSVGGRDPSRLLFQAVGGAEIHPIGVRIEGRAGIAYTTSGTVEPAFGLMLVVAPKVWTKR